MTERSSILRVAVLGAGAAAEWYYLPAIRAWNNRLELAGICDTSAERRERFGREYGCERLYCDFATMLSNCDCDAVAILTPHAGHAEQCRLAIAAGKHVMIEKPLAATTDDALAIVELAEKHNLTVSCAPPSMLHPGQRRLMQLVERRAIGDVCLVRITRSSMGPGSRPGAPTDFRWFYQSGAGGMSSMAGYGLMMATGILGPVQSLTAMSRTSIPQRTIRSGPAAGQTVEADVADNIVLTLNFGGSRLGTMDTGYCSMATRGPVLELFGTEGVICAWGGDMATRIEIYQDDWQTDVAGWRDVDIPGATGVWSVHPSTLLHLAEVVLDGRPLLTGPQQSAHIVEIIEKATQAAEEKREVELTTKFVRVTSDDLPLDDKGPNPFA